MSSACPSRTDGLTRQISRWIATVGRDGIGGRARRFAGHALLDWTGVTLAACREPLVDALIADALGNGEAGSAPLIGRPERLSPAFAALVNGVASHALDFDDVNYRLHGHPTVVIVPALLAAAPACGATGADVTDALVVGTEVSCAIGEMMGEAHYARGFHTTATVGCIGAARAVARLIGLDAETTAVALGLGATQAAGLKAHFGTMAKPLHAGRSAMAGLLAARWAKAGLTASPAAIEADQGFGPALSTDFRPHFTPPGGTFGIERNCYKYYPACYFTHSAIAAAEGLRDGHGLEPGDIAEAAIRVQPQHARACNIAEPTDGYGVKFSIRHLIAMALAGEAVGDPALYTPQTATRPDLVGLRERVRFVGDAGVPADDPALQETRLLNKFHTLADPALGPDDASALACVALDMADARDPAVLFHLSRTAP